MSEQNNGMAAWQMNNAGRLLFAVGATAATVVTTFLVFKWLAG
jgi:hypothetical protein